MDVGVEKPGARSGFGHRKKWGPRAAAGTWFGCGFSRGRVFLWKQGGLVASSRGQRPRAPPPGAFPAAWEQVKPLLVPARRSPGHCFMIGPPFHSARVCWPVLALHSWSEVTRKRESVLCEFVQASKISSGNFPGNTFKRRARDETPGKKKRGGVMV
jgi:hypothetical protein